MKKEKTNLLKWEECKHFMDYDKFIQMNDEIKEHNKKIEETKYKNMSKKEARAIEDRCTNNILKNCRELAKLWDVETYGYKLGVCTFWYTDDWVKQMDLNYSLCIKLDAKGRVLPRFDLSRFIYRLKFKFVSWLMCNGWKM